MAATCYFCGQVIEESDIEYHHPDKERFPDWTETTHAECHRRYHSEAGHFREWGSWSAYAGRDGYERCIRKWPAFHQMGGKARSRTAQRDERGRFLKFV